MRSTLGLPLVLLSLTISSLCAPIPGIPGSVEEECIYYASCRPYRQRPNTQSKSSPALQEPHFPTHQLKSSKQADTVEVRLLEYHVTTPTPSIQAETTIKNPNPNTGLKAAYRDKASTKKHYELGPKSASTEAATAELSASRSQSPSSTGPEGKKYSFTASVINKVQRVAGTRGRKCGMTSGTVHATDRNRDGRMIITYTYGYSYIRTDYTSILVVGIVVIFVLVVILVELLDKVIESTKALLGLDQGAIRLEDCDCKHGHLCPPYTYSPKTFRLLPAPPPRATRPRPMPQSPREESAPDEKSETRA